MKALALCLLFASPLPSGMTYDEQLRVNGLVFDPVAQCWFQNGVNVSVALAIDPTDPQCTDYVEPRGIYYPDLSPADQAAANAQWVEAQRQRLRRIRAEYGEVK